MTGCLSEDRLRLWIEGRPPADARADVERAHLQDCPACRAVIALARTSTLTATASAGSPPPTAPSLERGQTVGRYVILDVLGAGGMGVVYAAFDPELDRKVALKILRPTAADGADSHGFRDRLRREAQAMARLQHQNVIKVYDVGTKPGELFVAMELVDGTTLSAWLREKPRGWREVVAVFAQAGAGLAAAHDAGLVHRDFKPDNVLISRSGDVFVTDFGLARALGSPDAPPLVAASPGERALSPLDTPMTVTGALVGTPIYMAPEQLLGVAADARADVYSFCTALYEALFGQRPFAAKTIDELRAAVKAGKPREPDGARCPTWLKRVVMRGLSLDPAERYPSMRALLTALSRDPRARGQRLAIVVAAALILVSVGIAQQRLGRRQSELCRGGSDKLAGVWDAPRRAAVERAFAVTRRPTAEGTFAHVAVALDEYARRWADAHDDACRATRVRGEQSGEMLDLRMACLDARLAEARALVDLFARADGGVVDRAAAAVRSLEPPSSCAADVLLRSGRHLPRGGAARAEAARIDALVATAKAHNYAGRHKEGAPVAAAALAAADKAKLPELAAEARYWVGVFAYQLGQLDDAVRALERSGTDAQALGRDDLAARAYAFCAFLLGSQQRHFDAAHLALDVSAAALQRIGNRPDLAAFRLRQEASILTNEGRTDEAIAVYQRALDVQRLSNGDESLQLAEMYLGLSRAYTEGGRPRDALDAVQRACAMFDKLFGPDYPLLAEAQLQVGFILRQLGRGDDAVAAMQRALASRERVHGPDHPSVIEALLYLGDTLRWRGRPADALPLLERAIADGERIHTPYPDVPAAMIALGQAQLALGQGKRARASFEAALAHPKASELTVELGDARFGLAQLLWDGGEHARALAFADEAAAAFGKGTPNDVADRTAALARWRESHHR